MNDSFPLQPYFLYGTAWKEDRTAQLTFEALQAGFRGIDTANQRKHYHEQGVGEGVSRFLKSSTLKRENLFLQTKYTFANGQDHRKPYDERADFATQVRQSFESSLEHLQTTYLDSLVLHGPSSNHTLLDADWEAWQAMEALAQQGKVRFLGISNCHYEQLVSLIEGANIKPTFLQNRCYAASRWDQKIRAFCKENQIRYQGFSLLTANQALLAQPKILEFAQKYSKTVAQIIFRFSLAIGMLPLTGTSLRTHMIEDLDIFDFELLPEEIKLIEHLAG